MNLIVGQNCTFSISSNPVTIIPDGAVTATAITGHVTVTMNPDNTGIIHAVAPISTVSVVFSAPNYVSSSIGITVNPQPQLVFNQGVIS